MIKTHAVHVIPFKAGHLDFFTLKECYAGDTTLVERHDHLNASNFAHTLVAEGRPLAVFGGNVIWPGLAEIWSLTSPLMERYPVECTKLALDILAHYENKLSLRRMQATVKEDFHQGHAWVRVLGFEPECWLKSYGPEGANYWLYARVK